MKLSHYLARERVTVISADGKRAALDRMLELFHDSPCIADLAAFAEGIWQREEVLPTGIGLGIAVPHVRSPAVRDPVAALAVLREGIDYDSIDGVPVRVILMIGMPDGEHKQYLEYLAKASLRFKDPEFRETLCACANAEALWEAVKTR